MATIPPVAPTPGNWLKKVGSFFSKLLHIVATDAQPIEKIAVPVAKALLPQFALLIDEGDSIFSNIVKEAVVAETVVQAAGTMTGGGAQKLKLVLANAGPLVDQWIAANFPGSAQVSTVAKSGLISAVVQILNELKPPTVPAA